MTDISEIVNELLGELDGYDQQREQVIKLTRKLNRISGKGVASLVKGEKVDSMLEEARQIMAEINQVMGDIAALTSWKITNDGVEEYAELEILNALVNDQTIPRPQELKIPSWVWISSVGDVIGELRRLTLNCIIRDEIDKAEHYIAHMQDIFKEIRGLSFSKNLIPNLRKKTDVARILVERTESDFVTWKMTEKINRSLARERD